MFDVGWSEMVVIGIVALIAIGPKELPGVLRTVGQWIGKARRMASEFQGQFQEAIREAEMADIKKQFDEVSAAATEMTSNPLAGVKSDVEKALMLDPIDTPQIPAPPTPETFREAAEHDAAAPQETPVAALPLQIASILEPAPTADKQAS